MHFCSNKKAKLALVPVSNITHTNLPVDLSFGLCKAKTEVKGKIHQRPSFVSFCLALLRQDESLC